MVLALVITGCSWSTHHGGPDRVGWQTLESKIGVGNVSQLTLARQYPNASSPPVVVGGILYSVTRTGILQAFDATGATCEGTPRTCFPRWNSSGFAGRAVTVAGGRVYVAGDGGLRVFDAAGCGGAACAPLWTTGTFANMADVSPALVDGKVYVSGRRSRFGEPLGNAYVIVYDASGCGGAVCGPLWSSTAAPTDVLYSEDLAVVNGVVYAFAGNQVVAFDAGGCGNTSACAPLWTASLPAASSSGGLAVANGRVFVASGGKLYAIDAAGNGCTGTPRTCNTLWSADVGDIRNTPAVAGGIVYVTNVAGTLRAFDAMGCNGSVCPPLWTFAVNETGTVVTGSPAVANGVVYAVSAGANFRGFDAAGTINCQNTPKTCTGLWSTSPGLISSSASPAIVDGTVYWNSSTASTTWAYTLNV